MFSNASLYVCRATTDGKGNYVSADVVNEMFSYAEEESSTIVVHTCLNFFERFLRKDKNILQSMIKLARALDNLKS